MWGYILHKKRDESYFFLADYFDANSSHPHHKEIARGLRYIYQMKNCLVKVYRPKGKEIQLVVSPQDKVWEQAKKIPFRAFFVLFLTKWEQKKKLETSVQLLNQIYANATQYFTIVECGMLYWSKNFTLPQRLKKKNDSWKKWFSEASLLRRNAISQRIRLEQYLTVPCQKNSTLERRRQQRMELKLLEWFEKYFTTWFGKKKKERFQWVV